MTGPADPLAKWRTLTHSIGCASSVRCPCDCGLADALAKHPDDREAPDA